MHQRRLTSKHATRSGRQMDEKQNKITASCKQLVNGSVRTLCVCVCVGVCLYVCEVLVHEECVGKCNNTNYAKVSLNSVEAWAASNRADIYCCCCCCCHWNWKISATNRGGNTPARTSIAAPLCATLLRRPTSAATDDCIYDLLSVSQLTVKRRPVPISADRPTDRPTVQLAGALTMNTHTARCKLLLHKGFDCCSLLCDCLHSCATAWKSRLVAGLRTLAWACCCCWWLVMVGHYACLLAALSGGHLSAQILTRTINKPLSDGRCTCTQRIWVCGVCVFRHLNYRIWHYVEIESIEMTEVTIFKVQTHSNFWCMLLEYL